MKKFYTLNQIAEIWGISRPTVFKMFAHVPPAHDGYAYSKDGRRYLGYDEYTVKQTINEYQQNRMLSKEQILERWNMNKKTNNVVNELLEKAGRLPEQFKNTAVDESIPNTLEGIKRKIAEVEAMAKLKEPTYGDEVYKEEIINGIKVRSLDKTKMKKMKDDFYAECGLDTPELREARYNEAWDQYNLLMKTDQIAAKVFYKKNRELMDSKGVGIMIKTS